MFERILDNLHVAGDGPMIIRVGGDSADHSYWESIDRVMPARAFELTPTWLQRTRRLVRSADLRLILDLNLVANSPSMAAGWASAATAALPRGTVIGYEVGNEPDLYHRSAWYRLASIARSGIARALTQPGFSPRNYVSGFGSYARALAGAARGVPILGPAVANPSLDVNWVSSLLARQPRAVGIVTAHRYPLSQCAVAWSPRRPTIARVLSERSSAGMARSVRAAVMLAHRAGLKFRLTELNSVTCGGTSGRQRHVRDARCGPPMRCSSCFAAGLTASTFTSATTRSTRRSSCPDDGVRVRPLLYGMIMFARMLGPGARLLPTQTQQRRGLHLKAWAVSLAGHTTARAADQQGPAARRCGAAPPRRRTRSVERLLAPSVSARSGVRLAGQHLNANAVWQNDRGRRAAQPRPRSGYRVTMPGDSAALISVPPAPAHAQHLR